MIVKTSNTHAQLFVSAFHSTVHLNLSGSTKILFSTNYLTRISQYPLMLER